MCVCAYVAVFALGMCVCSENMLFLYLFYQHKTFHRYVVRQKQGGVQSSKDSAGRAPKSAGASLRRYNENALSKDIKVKSTTFRPEDSHFKKN